MVVRHKTTPLHVALREARERKGLTTADVASAVGRSQETVRRWERGDHEPGARLLLRLAGLLGLDLSEL